MNTPRHLPLALLILRLGIGAFLLVWASLKFLRPEWMVNVFRNTYQLDWVTADYAYAVGTIQLILVLAFIFGLFRTISYGLTTIMHGTGIIGALLGGNVLFKGGIIGAVTSGNFVIGYTSFPANLLWTSVSTLAALVALFLLRHADRYTIDGMRNRT
ncbi:MAG: hypothetical protein AAFO70_07025 [Pseudomonadota bacterium]